MFRNRVYHLYKSVPFTVKRLGRPETRIKDGFEEMEHELATKFRLENSVRKNKTTFSDAPLFRDIFHWEDPKVVFHLVLSNRISRKIFVNGKQT